MNITTINVRGLNNPNKRTTILHWLKCKSIDIVCLQETFSTKDSVKVLFQDWDGPSFHSVSNSSHSKGVSILIKKDFQCDIISHHEADDGRKVLINIKHNDQVYTIASIYAPTEMMYRKDFLHKTRTWINERSENSNCIIVTGDFNCSLANIDRKVPNFDRSRSTFKDFMSYLDLKDTYREINKDKVSYTYSNNKGNIQSRIDYILCTPYVNNLAKKCYTLNPPKVPDHKAVVCCLREDIECGKGYWKLNCSLLSDKQYIVRVKGLLNEVREQYKDIVDSRRLWDLCKVFIKEESIKWCSLLRKNKKNEQNEIMKALDKLDKNISTEQNEIILDMLTNERHELKQKLDQYHECDALGAQVRARVKWIEEGEKNTKYFLNLEKKHQTNNRITCVTNENGVKCYKSSDILQEGANFYKKLYHKKECSEVEIDKYLDEIITNETLTDIDASQCEGLISEEECFAAINRMAKNKSPGYDGLPIEFYLTFWEEIKDLIIASFNESFKKGELSEMQKQIVISLIFKKGERKQFKNYRPISLSNVDYKILAFVLAGRLHTVIGKIISPEQVAYIKERYIGTNVRLLLDVMEYIKRENKNGVLLFLDFEKAFDSLDWNFIHKCMKKFGFKEQFCKWIQIIYTKPRAFLKINGFLSGSISIERGIRQGCPLSCLIFIICVVG